MLHRKLRSRGGSNHKRKLSHPLNSRQPKETLSEQRSGGHCVRGAYDSVMRSSIEEFIKSEDTDINGDRPMSGVSNQMIEQFSAEWYKKAYDCVVKEMK